MGQAPQEGQGLEPGERWVSVVTAWGAGSPWGAVQLVQVLYSCVCLLPGDVLISATEFYS